jgi:tocopherol O-methyltransferase
LKAQQHDVERYYERNTRRFLWFGGGRHAHAIHRQLWGDGVTDVDGAARHINELLTQALGRIANGDTPIIIDFGCGVGGTVMHLAAAFPDAHLHGVTISRQQVEIATGASREAGLDGHVQFHVADFESLELDLAADAIVAIESFIHSRSADSFFATAARHLKPGGSLIVIDDFTTRASRDQSPAEQRQARQFRDGWRVPGLCTTRECAKDARRHGLELEAETDLTGLIRLRRPRDRLIALVAPVAALLGLARVPFFGNLIGGNALHAGLVDGLFQYRWLSFRRTPQPHPD